MREESGRREKLSDAFVAAAALFIVHVADGDVSIGTTAMQIQVNSRDRRKLIGRQRASEDMKPDDVLSKFAGAWRGWKQFAWI